MSQDAQRIDPSVMPGARPAPSPGFIEPCRRALREEAPSGGRWVHEIKFYGYPRGSKSDWHRAPEII
jgi:bifunctional non-homologous end joining protein LigD